ISNREINVLTKFNPNVSFSPVPIRPEEYEINAPDVRAKYGISKDAMLFLALGRVSRLKGQDLAVKAFVAAANDMPGSVMAVVGRNDYEPELKADLEQLVSEKGLGDRVKFTGVVDREDVIGFLKQSDIHVIPVRFMNSGAVVVESWAGGIPVIQSDAVDPNLVEEDVNGYIFPKEDIQALSDKMRKAFANRAKLPAMAQNGRKLVMQGFTYEHLVDIYEDVYSRLVK
ncbi:MAG: glycosyltransferase family 4 protein, partial [Victivallales bacterium]|nr:glycosyltransferase family 4 protein [Victivallales bacterium]